MTGLVGALELVPAKMSRRRFEGDGKIGLRCREHSFRNGLVMRHVHDTMIIAPPLVLSHEEADELIRLATLMLDMTHADLKRDGLMGWSPAQH